MNSRKDIFNKYYASDIFNQDPNFGVTPTKPKPKLNRSSLETTKEEVFNIGKEKRINRNLNKNEENNEKEKIENEENNDLNKEELNEENKEEEKEVKTKEEIEKDNIYKLLEKKSEVLRRYLSENVLPLLSLGILQIATERPDDPVEALADFLLDKTLEIEKIEADKKKKAVKPENENSKIKEDKEKK